ncbi:MAG: hypothetical protein ACYSW7_02400 [Planctomycetota bacterium]
MLKHGFIKANSAKKLSKAGLPAGVARQDVPAQGRGTKVGLKKLCRHKVDKALPKLIRRSRRQNLIPANQTIQRQV